MDDATITDNIGSARAGGQIGHPVTNDGDITVHCRNPSADNGFAVAATKWGT
jgi:hypothetical protein